MQNDLLNTRALFTDQTQEFLKVQTIKPLKKYGKKQYAIRIRLRTAAGDVDRSILLTEEREIRMQVEKENAYFIYFSAEITTDGKPVRYAFRLRLARTGEEFLYKRTGVEWPEDAADGSETGDSPEKETEKSPTEGWWYFAPEFKTPEWAQGAVMYQIFTDRFCNGDRSNDVLTGEYAYNGGQVRHIDDWYYAPEPDDTREHYGGDLQGIIDKLGYLEDLGVEAIYLNPIFISPSNHKYDTQDYDHIDPHFGKIVHDHGEILPKGELDNSKASKYKSRVTDPANLEASDRLFAKLVREAHMRGIRVILDGVFNHCGSFHRWMDHEKIYLGNGNHAPGAYLRRDSEFREFFDFEKDAWPDNDSYESWWGFSSLPKLNYEDSMRLRDEILRTAAKWVSPPYNADGAAVQRGRMAPRRGGGLGALGGLQPLFLAAIPQGRQEGQSRRDHTRRELRGLGQVARRQGMGHHHELRRVHGPCHVVPDGNGEAQRRLPPGLSVRSGQVLERDEMERPGRYAAGGTHVQHEPVVQPRSLALFDEDGPESGEGVHSGHRGSG